jgi:hypothetical protein
MATPAFDILDLPARIDTLDATDSVDRNLQVCYMLAAAVAITLRDIESPGATLFKRPGHILAANTAVYESYVANALSAAADLVAALQFVADEDGTGGPYVNG